MLKPSFARLLGLFLLLAVSWGASGGTEQPLVVHTKRGDVAFQVEVAATEAERGLGLMHRKALKPRHGMLFVSPKAEHAQMWMKDTLIPLDMIFIAPDKRIARIHEKAKPLSVETIASGAPVIAVLEISGGSARRLGLRLGDHVSHPRLK